jgi:hypothetical protein
VQTSVRLCMPPLLFLTLLAEAAFAATDLRMSYDALLERSDTVVYGRVVAVHSFWDERTRTIWTDTHVQVLDAPKGKAPAGVTITEPGGVIGDVAHLFAGIPRFGVNQEVVVFLHRPASRNLRVTGLQQGVYLVSTDPATGVKTASPCLAGPDTVFEAQRRHPAAARGTPRSIVLGELLASIRRKAAVR